MKSIVVIGNSNLDIIFNVDRIPEMHEKLRVDPPGVAGGGSAGNTACWLSNLGHRVTMITALADDSFSDYVLRSFEHHGIDVQFGERQKGRSIGVAAILSMKTDKRMIIGRSTALLSSELIRNDFIPIGSHVHYVTSDKSLEVSILEACEQSNATVSSEFNGGWYPERLADIDVCFTNLDELKRHGLTADDIGNYLKELQIPGLLVVTDGTAKVMCFDNTGLVEELPVVAVVPVDRTGAGDAFNAGFLSEWTKNSTLAECIQMGMKTSKAVVQQIGARPKEIHSNFTFET